MPVALAGLLWLVLPGEKNLRIGMAIFALISGLWVSQGLPLAVTALAVPLLACLSGLHVPRQALASFANPVIFLSWVALLWRRLSPVRVWIEL